MIGSTIPLHTPAYSFTPLHTPAGSWSDFLQWIKDTKKQHRSRSSVPAPSLTPQTSHEVASSHEGAQKVWETTVPWDSTSPHIANKTKQVFRIQVPFACQYSVNFFIQKRVVYVCYMQIFLWAYKQHLTLNLPHFLTSLFLPPSFPSSFTLSSFLPTYLPPHISSSKFHSILHYISQKLLPSSLKKYCVRTTKAKVLTSTVHR